MSRNRLLIIIGLVALLSIGTAFFFSNDKGDMKGNGNVEELSPEKMKVYMNENGNGFIMSVSDDEKYAIWLKSIKTVIKNQKVNAKIYNENRGDIPMASRPTDYGLKQKRDSLAFYIDGESKGEIKFDKYNPSELESEISNFIKNMKETYMN